MSKKDYINAVNEINVNDTLKQETLKKQLTLKKIQSTDITRFTQ